MSRKRLVLTELKPGQSGTIVELLGGQNLISRLQSLGVRPGKKVTKISSVFARGPVVIRADSIEVALGYGKAKKIMVEVGENEDPLNG